MWHKRRVSKRENHWYLVGTTFDVLAKRMVPRLWVIGLWVALFIAFFLGFQTGALDRLFQSGAFERLLRSTSSPMFVPVVAGLLVVLALGAGVLLALVRRASARSEYLKALASPASEALIEAVEKSMRPLKRLPDRDAFLAQSKAIAYALYGCERDAVRALGTVEWNRKAPLIQAVGLSAESVVELLCRRAAPQALELARRASEKSNLSAAFPGSAANRRYYAACVAVSEALSNVESPSGIQVLEQSAADGRYPPLQILATFGLAAAMERSGERERAAQLRDRLRQVAPHCAPIHEPPEQFAASPASSDQTDWRPVSAALSSSEMPADRAEERSAKRKIVRWLAVRVGLWVALVVLFLVMYARFSRPH